MHELGIMNEVVKVVLRTMEENGLKRLQTVVLQVGELSQVVPEYLEFGYSAACYKTSIEGSTMEIENIPGIARCLSCGNTYKVVENEGKCPDCFSSDYEIIAGSEFLIKHIVAE